MAFWDWLVSFLNRLGFFAKPAQSVPTELPLVEIPAWLDEQTKTESIDLEKQLTNQFSEIRFLLKQIATQLTQLGQDTSELLDAPSRLQKVVESTQHTMVQRLGLLVSRLEPPRTKDWSTIQNYCESGLELFQKETNSIGKNIAYTSLLRKNELQGLANRLVELETTLKKVRESFESPRLKNHARAKQQALELSELRRKSEALQTEQTFLVHELSGLLEHQTTLQAELSTLEQSAESAEWSRLQTENRVLLTQQKELEQNMVGLVTRVEKPLKRFSQLSASGTWKLEKNLSDFAKTLSEKPLSAFEIDPKGERFKQILLEIQKAIQEQKIVFKDEKETTRYLETVQELLAVDFFSAFFWKKNELVRQQNQLQNRLQSDRFFNALSQKKTELEKLREKTVLCETELGHKKTAFKKNSALFEEKKTELERTLHQLVSQPVSVLA